MPSSRIRTMLSISEVKNETIHAALKASEPAKEWRSHVAVHLSKISVVREIDRIQPHANLVPAPVLHQRQAQMKISINLRIDGKESWEARAIRQPCVVLEHVDVRIGKARVHVSTGLTVSDHGRW